MSKLKEVLKTESIRHITYSNELKESFSSASVVGSNMNGKRVVITGANGGIGTAICLRYAKEGCDILFTVRNESKKEQLLSYLKSVFPHGRFEGAIMDLSSPNSIKKFLSFLEGKNVDVLVNNAGIFTEIDKSRAFRKVPAEAFSNIIRTNFLGMKQLTEGVVEIMNKKNARGSIVNISSICPFFPNYSYTPYGISKTAVLSYTKDLIQKYKNINIHSIAPGTVATNMNNCGIGSNIACSRNYIKRCCLPEEIASLVVFLSSDYGRFITNDPIIASAGEIL